MHGLIENIANETMNFPLLWPDILWSVFTVDMNVLLKGEWVPEAQKLRGYTIFERLT